MKRPHSAKPPRNYWAQASSDQILTLEQSRGKGGRRAQLQNSTSNDLSRLLPKKITHDKERLYCEALNLKNNLNEITEENLRLKTRVAILERQKDKLQRDERPALSKNTTIVVGKSDKQNGMVANLKKMVREAREDSEGVKLELAKLKRTIRYTKLNECEIERQTVLEQNRKQIKLIMQLRMELETRVRQEEEVNELHAELKSKTKELQETNHDNLQYEEILTEMEERHAETGEKLMLLEKKYQRDMAVERRKAENMGRINQGLKAEVKKLKAELEEEKKKIKKVIRPASSTSYKAESVRGKEKQGQVMEAIVANQKLQKELEEAKKKLAESQQLLKTQEKLDNEFTRQKVQDKSKSIVSPIQDNSLNIHSVIKQDEEYAEDFEISHIPTIKPSKKEQQKPIPPPPIASPLQPPIIPNESPIHKQIRQILTYRMKYNRYPFNELKADIEVSPLSSFTFADLLSMLTSQPFFLSERYAREFLKTCYGKTKMHDGAELDVDVLLTNLRRVIDDFQLIDEQQEENRMHKLAEVLTKNRKTIQEQLTKIAKKGLVSKQQLISILSQHAEITTNEIDVGICYVSVNSLNLNSISFLQLLDKFMLVSSPKKKNSQTSEARKEEQEELSLGENDDFEPGEPISDDQLI